MKDQVSSVEVLCPGCRIQKDPSSFYVDRSKASGRKSHCKACSKKSCNRWKSANRPQLADYASRRRRCERQLKRLIADQAPLSYRCVDDDRAIQEAIAIFGDEWEQCGIHLVDDTSKYVLPSCAELIRSAIEDVPDISDYGYSNKEAMFQAALFIRAFIPQAIIPDSKGIRRKSAT